MGHGTYSVSNSIARNVDVTHLAATLGVAAANAATFTARKINSAMKEV